MEMEQTRDFIFVKQEVNANIIAAESKETEVFNIDLEKAPVLISFLKL